MQEVWKIAGQEIAPGERLEVYIAIEHSTEKLPVTFLNGRHEGKTILLTSGIHGGEYEGIRTATELARELDPEEIYGQIAILHPCNVQTFCAREEKITPEDGKNLDQVFPPNQHGTLTDQIAWTLWNQFQSRSDFHIDLHGCYSDFLTPHVYYTGVAEETVVAQARAAASVVGVPYMVRSVGTRGCYNHGGVCGIPGILIEHGESNLVEEKEICRYKTDVRNVLRHLGVLKSPMEPQPVKPVEVCDLTYATSKIDQKGCWYPAIDPRKPFRKGDKLGEVRDFFGNVLDTTYAAFDGVSLYMYGMMPIDAYGHELCYARICDSEKNL